MLRKRAARAKPTTASPVPALREQLRGAATEGAVMFNPLFATWRRVWIGDTNELDAELRLVDELASRRARGRMAAPDVTKELLLYVLDAKCRALLRAELKDDEALAVLHHLWPLVRAAVWPRWLMLEAALDDASTNGSLHLAALALRTQIEELDVLGPLGRLEAQVADGNVEEALLWECIGTLNVKVLPRLRSFDQEQLLASSNTASPTARSTRLQEAFDALGDYVHPNYGSHVLALRPGSKDAARVLLGSFRAVYEAFFDLPWAKESGIPVDTIPADPAAHPFDVLAAAIPTLMFTGANTFGHTVDDLVATCRRQVAEDARVDEIALLENVEPIAGGTSAVLLALNPPPTMPSFLRSRGDRWRHDKLLDADASLSAEATRVATARTEANRDDEAWLAVLREAIEFSGSLTEYKLTMLGRDAARMIASGNVLGAALVVRAILEHHAVAIDLGEKLRGQWERFAKVNVAKDEKVVSYLQQAEKQLARTLASGPASSEGATRWRDLWREAVRVYHVMDPVKALDAEEPGFLQTYGLLSHIIHGTAATGGDLLGPGGVAPRRQTLLQLVIFLLSVIQTNAVLDRIALPALVSHRIEGWEKTAGVSLACRVDKGRVPAGQKLKLRKDVFGNGTREDPFRFREGLLYHENYARYLSELGVTVASRQVVMLENGVGDEVFTADGRTLYFLDNKLSI